LIEEQTDRGFLDFKSKYPYTTPSIKNQLLERHQSTAGQSGLVITE